MFNKISIFLFYLLPISLISGNFVVNLNILLIDTLALYYCYQNKNWDWIKDDIFKLLIIFNFFLIINSITIHYLNLIGPSNYDGLIRSLTFSKFILFVYAFKILILDKKTLDKIIKVWSIIIGVVIFDVFFENYFGFNIIGNISPDLTRIVSFFKDESVVGALILCFGFIIATHFLDKDLELKSKIFFNIALFIIPLSIFLSGERSNFIKSFIIFSLIIFLINKKKLFIGKKKFFMFLVISCIATVFLSKNIYIKQTEIFKRIIVIENPEKFTDRFQNIKYFAHYDVALKIFKDFPITGVGNKNFRFACYDEKYTDEKIKFTYLRCNTHPHQIHFELLSEHGLIGYIFFFYIMFVFLKKNLIAANSSKSILHYSSIIYLIVFFIPLLPGGALFSTFNGFLFWLLFAIANFKLYQKSNF